MRKKLTDKFNIGILFRVIISALCIFMLYQNFPFCKSLIEKTAVLSAKTVIVGAKSGKSKSSDETEPTEQQDIRENEEVQNTQSESVQQTQTQTETQSEAETVSQITDENFTRDPEDIQKLIEEYSRNSGKDKKDGAITEQTFKTAGVTDSYKNIRVKNVNDTGISIPKLLKRKPDIRITDKSKPTVLIYHTHTTEAYQMLDRSFYARGYTSRSDDSSKNMVRVGDEICRQLENAGFNVIHDTTIYDKQYNGAYRRSRVTVEDYLKKYPSIQITLDIHRDAIQYNNGTKVKPVTEVMGKKCAQMMIISGCQEKGNGIAGFDDWEYNLVFAVHLQKQLEDMFPGIMRPLYFCPRRYNMDVNRCSLLVEMGSDANTLAEGVYAGRCLGSALASLMEKYCD